MLSRKIYEDFFSSSFLSECRKQGLTTNDFFTFVNTFCGVKNFVRNHLKPVINYYWVLGGGQSIKQIAERFDIPLKKIKIADVNAPNIAVAEDEYLISPDIFICYGPECYGGIEAIKKDICRAAHIVDLKTCDIIQNEDLWERCEFLRDEFHSTRHSSDEFEYQLKFKTGWAYLVENKSVILDLPLISFLKERNIALKKERVDEYVGYSSGCPYPIETLNGLMAFRTHPIDENIVPIIMNDPIQWEGIFYDQNFCNDSILKYIRSLVSTLEDIL